MIRSKIAVVTFLYIFLMISASSCSSENTGGNTDGISTTNSIAEEIVNTVGTTMSPNIVATVNEKQISRENLALALEDLKAQYASEGGFPEAGTPKYTELQQQVAERLVNEEILWSEAEKMGFTVSDIEVNTQIDQYKQEAGGEEQFNTQLQQQSYTLDRLKNQVRKSLIFQKLFPEVTKNAQIGATNDQTMGNQRAAFEIWFNSTKGNYTIKYADEFKPTSTTMVDPTNSGVVAP